VTFVNTELYLDRSWVILTRSITIMATSGFDNAIGNLDSGRVVTEETALLSGGEPHRSSSHHHGGDGEDDTLDEQESWNLPKINAFRFVSVNLTLLIMGMNDACIGVSEDLETYENIKPLTRFRR